MAYRLAGVMAARQYIWRIERRNIGAKIRPALGCSGGVKLARARCQPLAKRSSWRGWRQKHHAALAAA